jgi:serine/threonine protein kinase
MVKPSERLGNYEVATAADGSALVLGSGAGGVTYRGRHIHLGTEVAIKVLIRRKNLLQKDRDAFLSEARSAASLTHPQIARILDFGESAQQHPYYVMELCEGGSLEEFGSKAGPPDEYAFIQWFFESAAALAHAHQKGILHRDIKPSNLLVARQNESASVKLIDFGLADHANHSESSEHVIGTPHFAAPEQLRGQAEPASDVFSLGATFLWLLTGKHLSQGDVKSVISDRLDAVSYAPLLESLTAPWQTLLGRMLDVDPSRRPRDGGEVLGALQAVFPNHPGHPVAWDASAEFPGVGTRAPLPSQWEDFPDASWADRWTETSTPIAMDHGVAVVATRAGGNESLDVSKFTRLSPDIAEILTYQGDLLAAHAHELGLDRVILERGRDWHAVAWPSLGTNDALSWVRQGHSAPIAEVLAALDPIATALDAIKSAGLDQIEIHPSMLIVRVAVPQKISHSATRDPRDLWEQETPGGTPLKFSLAVPLPILASTDQASDSGGTMRGTTGAGLSARFASSVYQLLSGRTPAPAAFVNARAYQAIPKLTEKSNRFLSSAIAGTITGGSCRDVIRGLAHEERIPGASLTGSLSSSASAGSRSAASWQSQSNPPISLPTNVPPPIPSVPPPPKAEVIAAVPSPQIAPVVGTLPKQKKSPVLIISVIAAALILSLGAAAWIIVPKLLTSKILSRILM